MNDFIKVFVRGIVVTLLLPFILAFLLLYTVYCLIVYIIALFRNTIIFFMGGNPIIVKEDLIAKETLARENQTSQNASEMLANIMHEAIQQHPEAIKAMAQQEIATQGLANKTESAQINQINEPKDVIDETSQSILIEEDQQK